MDKRPESNENPPSQVPHQDATASSQVAELPVDVDKDEGKVTADIDYKESGDAPATGNEEITQQTAKNESIAASDAAQLEPGRESALSPREEQTSQIRKSVTAPSSKKRKEKSRKAKRKLKSEGQESIPTLRKRSSRLAGAKQLEDVLIAAYQPLDPEGTGSVSQEIFWEVRAPVYACMRTCYR